MRGSDLSKVAIVTGGGSGIGRASALALARSGFSVVVAGRRKDALDETAKLAGEAHIVPFQADVSDASQVEALFSFTKNQFSRLDFLFNNAGRGAPGINLEELTPQQWLDVVGVNLNGAFYCTQQAFKIMKDQDPRGGRIVNNGSISAHAPRPNSAPYTATKHAITGLTKATSLDGRKYDIACGQIDIGNALTDMTRASSGGQLQPSGQVVPEARMDVEHVAQAIVMMAGLPLESNVQFITIMATKMPFVGRG
jgi:NAD(P)-dependent dehydrogenase (short-subunit alcohol dehydrogenase family)